MLLSACKDLSLGYAGYVGLRNTSEEHTEKIYNTKNPRITLDSLELTF